jgi:hypothetical protein
MPDDSPATVEFCLLSFRWRGSARLPYEEEAEELEQKQEQAAAAAAAASAAAAAAAAAAKKVQVQTAGAGAAAATKVPSAAAITTSAAAAAASRVPEHRVGEAEGLVVVVVELPGVAGMAAIELDMAASQLQCARPPRPSKLS